MDFSLTARYFFAQQQLNYDMTDSLKRGLVEAPENLRIALSRLEAYASTALLEQLNNLGFQTDYTFKEAKKKDQTAVPDKAIVYEQYVKFIKGHYVHMVATSAPLDCRNLSDAENQRIRAEHGAREMSAPEIDTNDPVAVAWRLARENQERTVQRVGAVYYLASQLSRGLSTLERQHLENDNQALATYLYQRARSFAHHEMMFAIILGGSALESTRQKLFDEELNGRYSIMQYLEQDGNLPGRYPTSVEEGFRAKLQEYRDKH
jgi:hypothetical protein